MSLTTNKSAVITALMLGAAAPAMAQDNFCGTGDASGQWIGGTEAGSDIAIASSYQEQMALVLGGNEYVSLFRLSEGAEVRVEAAGRGNGDPIIDLLDADGAVILSDDDSGGNAASRAETFLNPGIYCMALRSYDGGPMTAFVRVGLTHHEPLTEGVEITSTEATGSCDTATPFDGVGASVSAATSVTPYWSFTLDTPTAISLTAENETADPVLTLYTGSGDYIDENDDFDGYNSRLDISEPLDAGTYCVGLESLSDDTVPVTLTVNEYDPEAALQAIYDQGEAAPPLDGSVEVTALGVLETRIRQDVQASTRTQWFTFDMEETGLVLAEAIGAAGSDPWLVIYDDLGRELGQNDDYGDGLDSLVAAKVEPGTYIVGVKQYESGQGLIRLALERYVRAR